MGSSSYNNLNPFPCFPPPSTTSYNLPLSLPSLLNSDPSPNNTTTFNFHQPHQDPVSFLAPYFPIGHFSALTPPEAAVINFAVAGNNIQALGDIVPSAPGAGTGMGKKDRHSKIYTAQGLRDRRVRLSIDIARKFFDLQDMLGYDKASKTLEWLFSKSKKAIKELSRAKYGNVGVHEGTKKMSLAASSSDVEEEEEEDDKQGWGLKMKSMLSIDEDIKEQEKVSKKVEVFNLLAKESRAKARARARERTMEKKQVGDDDNNGKIYCHQKSGAEEVSDHWISKHLNQSTETSNLSMEESSFMNNRRVVCAKKFIDDDSVKPCRDDNAGISQWKLLDQMKGSSKGHLQEGSMIKRKLRPSIISGSSQRNLLISIDGIPMNLTQNWDTNSNPNYPFAK